MLPSLTYTLPRHGMACQAHHTILALICNKSQCSPQLSYHAQVQTCNYLWDSYLLVNVQLPDLQSQMLDAIAGRKHPSIDVCK